MKVYILCDCSGSMSGGKFATMTKMVDDYLAKFSEQAKAMGLAFSHQLCPFTETVRFGGNLPIFAGGGTALWDSMGITLDAAIKDGDTALIQVFTDGMDEHSRIYSAGRVAGMLKQAEATGRITVGAAGPKEALTHLIGAGLPETNFKAWDGSAKSMDEVARATVASTVSYVQDIAKGKTKSERLYADTEKLHPSAVRGYAKEVTPAEIKTVTKAMAGRSIADFFGSKFKAGNHYYQMVKPEYIQDDKELIVHIKDANEYRLGSRSVRSLLGLPEIGKIRVHPGPQSDKFTLFVQSSSVNRKVVEGQVMLSLEA